MSLMISISGIRGIVGETMTPHLAASAGCAMATFVRGGRVVIGRDSRPSGPMVASSVIGGLLAGGCDVIDLGVVSTPGVGMMVRKLAAAGGIVLTASHNPTPYNGIKFITAQGAAPPADVARGILDILKSESFDLVPTERVGRVTQDDSTHEYHVARIVGLVGADKIRAKRFRVVLDSVNGAGGPAGKRLLEALGCTVVHMSAEPTGIFAHLPEPIAENLGELCERTKAERADVGFAQDPDADRLAIVDENGRYIGEEYTVCLAAKHIFASSPGSAAVNLSTSRMIDDLAARAGGPCTVHRSAVGEANVAEMMTKKGCVIGGEGNGGVIDPRAGWIRNSLVAMALALQVMADDDKPLSAIVDEMPAYAMIKRKFDCDKARIARALEAIKTEFANTPMSTIDGVRIDWPQGWVHVRGSNTEPIMRIIGEGPDSATAEALISRVRRVVDAVL